MVEGTPPGHGLPPALLRATPARKGARCGAGAGSPRPHRPYPVHTENGTLAARSRGRAAGRATAPDTRRPSPRWQATPPRDGPPPPPRHAAPTGHAGQGDSVGPPHPHIPAHSTWVADPNSPPSGRAVGGGTAPDLRRPSQWWKAPPPRERPSATPTASNAGPQGRTLWGRSGSPRPHRPHPGHTGRGTLAAGSRGRASGGGTAPDTSRPSQQRQATPPPGTAPHQPRGTQPPQGMQAKKTVSGPHTHTPTPTARGWRTPTARPVGEQSGEGQPLNSDAPHNGGRHPPRGRPSATPTASNAGPQGRTLWGRSGSPRPHRPHPGHTGRGILAVGSRGQASGGGTAPDTSRPSQRRQATPPGDGPPPPPRHAGPTGHSGQGDSVGPPHPHTRAHSTWVADPNSPPSGRAVRGGTAPDLRRPSQWWKAPPPGTHFRHPHSEQRRPARADAVRPVLGPRARTNHTRDTRVAVPRLPAPEDGRLGEGHRLTPEAPQHGGRPSPPGTPPPHPQGTQPPQDMQAKGTVLGPHSHTPAPTARGWWTPTARPVGGQWGEEERLASDAPHNGGGHPPRGRPSATPTASNAGSQGRTLCGRCWVPAPAPTTPGTHGSRYPGCPPQRTGGWGRDSA